MSEEKIRIDGDEITQALEDVRDRYAQTGLSQTEKSKKEVMEEIRAMLRNHPEMSNKDIAIKTGSTPKQVGAQRYLLTDKGKATQSRSYESQKRQKEGTKVAEEKITVPETDARKPVNQIDEIIDAYGRAIGVTFTREAIDCQLGDCECTVTLKYRRKA